MSPLEFVVPTIEFRLLGPVLIVFVAACLGVLIEAVAPRHLRDEAQLIITTLSLAGGLFILGMTWGASFHSIAAVGSLAIDGPTQVWWALILVFGLLSALLFAERKLYGGVTAFVPMAAAVPASPLERKAEELRFEHTEVFPLFLFAITGMMLFPAANDTLLMFVALEIFSLPLYLLSGLARRRRLASQEAALKYFLLGALSSAIFLFGVALLYGFSGSFTLRSIAAAIPAAKGGSALLILGLVAVTVGVLFKVGAVPFHSWTPDVYVGAPTPVTGFMAICTKIAAVGALARLLYVALGPARGDWQPVIAVVAILTMALGAVLAIVQTDVKRMLAYSSIAHAGFLLTAITGAATPQSGVPTGQLGSTGAIGFYLAAYGFATLGAFAILTMVRTETGEQNQLVAWAGLGKRHPVLAGAMTLFMLSFAGIPLTGGFIGKWAAFAAAFRGGYWWLVVIAVLLSLVAAYFYLRVIAVMYLSDETEQTAEVGSPGLGTWIVIVVGCIATLALGIVPGWAIDLATMSGQLLR
jgi:NADH-quinone oxidoreductase subunit N